jgi:hypothetical protein
MGSVVRDPVGHAWRKDLTRADLNMPEVGRVKEMEVSFESWMVDG